MGLGNNKRNLMPKGVYQHKKLKDRSPSVQETIRRCLKMGTTPEARKRALVAIKVNARDPSFRERMRAIGLAVHANPETRRKFMASHQNMRPHWKGGNGQEPVAKVQELAKRLLPLGFMMEMVVLTRGHGTGLRCPTSYKVDFGHPSRKVAVEVDGPAHRGPLARERDARKTAVLRALGWAVARVRH